MDVKVVLDWKSFLALGGSVVASIVACKLDTSEAERVSTHAVDISKELMVARNSNH